MGRVSGWSRRWTGVLLVAVVLLTGVIATAAAVHSVREGADRYAGQMMDRYTDDLVEAITIQVNRYGDTINDLAYAVGAQEDLTSADFARLAAGLNAKRLPGATGVAYVVPATTAQIPAVQRRWRAARADELTLTPMPGAAEHKFVIFDKQFTQGTDLQGIDLERSPQAAAALSTARASGVLTMSAAYQLLRDRALPEAERQTSVVLTAPVFSGLGGAAPDVFVGWVIVGLHGQDLLSHVLLARAQGFVQVRLTDPAGAGTTIATALPGTRHRDDALVRQMTFSVGQRSWHITVWPTTRVRDAADRGLGRLTLGAATVLTLLLATMTGVLAGSRHRALNQVDRATAALREDIERRERIEAQLREREQQLQHQAFHDPLTGLPNRLLFYDRVAHAIATHDRTDRRFAVLFVDLDGFKAINDTRGHNAGDTVLKVIADRLRTGLRAGDTVARLGGDEFAIVVEGLASAADARATAGHVIAAVERPIDVDGTPVHVSASVGIAVHRPDTDADDIIQQADTAMYRAKTGGKARYAEAEPAVPTGTVSPPPG